MLTANNRAYVRKTIAALGVVALVAGVLGSPAQARADRLDRELRFEIPAQSLATALVQFSKQAEVQLVTSSIELGSRETIGISGRLSIRRALESLLDRTGLVYSLVGENTVAIGSSGGTPNSIAFPLSGSDSSRTPSAPQALNDPQTPDTGTAKKAGFWDRFRLAQNEPSSQADGSFSKEENRPQSSDKNSESRVIDEVVVTGSRIGRVAAEGAQEVRIYDREQIERSGQTSIASFMSTLPEASVSFIGDGAQGGFPAATIQLRGLPVGTTLILINGRRIQTVSGFLAASGFVDLNNIPAAAVDRVEVLPEAGSAVYGADAIGGVVNIILRDDFEGLEVNAKYGEATGGGMDETNANVAWGEAWDSGSISATGYFQSRDELMGGERELTATGNFTPYGGPDFRQTLCNPGTVSSTTGGNLPGLSAPVAAVPPDSSGTATVADFVPTAGSTNLCGLLYPAQTLIPPTDRYGASVSAHFGLGASAELFAEVMYSHLEQQVGFHPPTTFSRLTVPAGNPYNPFGEAVRVAYAFSDLGRTGLDQTTDFYRPLIGVRGDFSESWKWELAAWGTREEDSIPFRDLNFGEVFAAVGRTDPATALNLFTAAAPGSPELLATLITVMPQEFTSQLLASNAFVSGPLFNLPAGSANVVLGTDYSREKQDTDFFFSARQVLERESYAFFGELRAPLMASASTPPLSDLLLSLAGRYDHSSDFGGETTGEARVEWRPVKSLLVRALAGSAYKAPLLIQLYRPAQQFQQQIADPLRGGEVVIVPVTIGGNPDLGPESADSYSFGLGYSSETGLNVQVTRWSTSLEGRIAFPLAEDLVNNESLFPGRVVRGPPSPSDIQQGQPGPLTLLDRRFLNAGELDVAGVDFGIDWHGPVGRSRMSIDLNLTYTDKYETALIPGGESTDRVGKGNLDGYAPEWKGSLGLGWEAGALSAGVTARYIDSRLDFDGQGSLSDIWFWDINLLYDFGRQEGPSGSVFGDPYVSVGAVNVFNELPEYAAYSSYGFDPTQSDIVGRVVYLQVGTRF